MKNKVITGIHVVLFVTLLGVIVTSINLFINPFEVIYAVAFGSNAILFIGTLVMWRRRIKNTDVSCATKTPFRKQSL